MSKIMSGPDRDSRHWSSRGLGQIRTVSIFAPGLGRIRISRQWLPKGSAVWLLNGQTRRLKFSALQYVQCSAVQCSAVQCSAVQCSAVKNSFIHHSAENTSKNITINIILLKPTLYLVFPSRRIWQWLQYIEVKTVAYGSLSLVQLNTFLIQFHCGPDYIFAF